MPFLLTSQQTVGDSIMHDGLERTYILYVPEKYIPGTEVPLILNFHGYTSNSLEQMVYGDFRPIADTAGFIVVHPMGTIDQIGNPHWNVGWGTSTVNDVGFTAALIDSLSAMYSID
jgi:polyhydroxybutyrate depolymerase